VLTSNARALLASLEVVIVDEKEIVEIAADGVRRPRHPERLEFGGVERAARQHGLLDLPRDLEVVLQREPVRHFQQHEQVEQQEPDQQR